jgi:hypothetical protein
MNVLNDHGAVLSGKDLVDYAKRRGLCQICGRTQTHRRSKSFFKKLKNQWQPLTMEDEAADDSTLMTSKSQLQRYLVYKGYCLQPTCYTLEEAKRELGELPALPPDGAASSRRNFDMDLRSTRSSLHKYSSAKFSSSSSTRSNTSYEFSIAEPQKVPVQNRLLRAHSTVSDVSSLGASAVSEDYEEENPYLREFKVQHVTGSKHSDVVNGIEKFHRDALGSDRTDLAGKQELDESRRERTIAGESDTVSESCTTGSEESDNSLNSLDSTSIMTINARGWFHDSASIKLPENYDVKVSPKRSSLLTIHPGSLRVLNLENSVTESTQETLEECMDSADADEEGIEIAFAPSIDADELPPKSNRQNHTPPCSGVTHLRSNVMKKVLAEATRISSKLSRDEHEKPHDDANHVLTVFQSAPLAYVHPITRRKHSFPLLDFEHESQLLAQSLGDGKKIVGTVRVETEIATFDRLSAFFAQGGRKVLHLSCHGHPEYFLLENGYGSAHPLSAQDLEGFVSKADLHLVFVSACHSRSTGETFLRAGVKHVVCCRQNSFNGRDETATEFARYFYKALVCHKTLQEAFDHAKASVGYSSLNVNTEEDADKFVLLPQGSCHNVTISLAEKRSTTNRHFISSSQATQSRSCVEMLKRQPKHFVGRGEDLFQLLDALRVVDWVHVHGEHGVGKTTLVAAAVGYVSRRHSFFLSDHIIWVKGPDDAREWRKSDSRKKTALAARPLIIFDARIETDAWTSARKAKFLLEVLSSGSQVKMISIGFDESIINHHRANSTFPPRSLHIERLNHHDSVCLFASLMSSSDHAPDDLASILSMPDVHSKPAFAMDDEAGTHDIRIVEDALMNYRKNKVYQRIGAGLPKHIVHMASNMPQQELEYCIRWANKGNEFPDTSSIEFPATRVQLEELIQCTLAKEARSLRQEDYPQAREFRETLEELQSLRSVLLTRQTLEKVLEAVLPKLQEAIRTRLYEQAEVLRNRRNYLERQLKRENEYLRTEEKFQQARRRASSFRSSSSSCGSVSSRGSARSAFSRTSLRSTSSRASLHSRTSQSSRSARVSFGPRIEMH